jgi:large subunit ribosomal protein L3
MVLKSPRKGSLQYWPRKRARKFLPSVNWNALKADSKLKGFICYKAGMASVFAKDETPDSMTKGKKIVVPVTILECPPLKIFSVRFYKDGKVAKEMLAEGPDKELKRAVKLPKQQGKTELEGEYDDVRVICYSVIRKTGMKKTPDISEIALGGKYEDKIRFIKESLGKEISVSSIFEKGKLIDMRGLTKGKGLQGPVRRFGITLKQHKSEKGVRRPGNLGPWHPARVSFRAPQAGQLGMFTRVSYNHKIIEVGKAEDKFRGIKNFGDIKTDYLLVYGSVPGVPKRQLLATVSLRATKKQKKKNYEVLELR